MMTSHVKRDKRSLVDFSRISTSTISDVLDKYAIRGIITGFSSVCQGARIVGWALPVREASKYDIKFSQEEFRIGEVLQAAFEGCVLVFDNKGKAISTWGDLASLNAVVKGVRGVIVNGGVRDIERIRRLGFPVFARHYVPTSGKGRIRISSINVPIRIQGVKISPNDIVVADDTGIAVIPATLSRKILTECRNQERLDRMFAIKIRRGSSLSRLWKKYHHI